MPYAVDREVMGLESEDEPDGFFESEDDDSAEFLPGLIGGVLPAVGGIVGNLLGGIQPRPPLAKVPGSQAGAGVGSAMINTPRGSATLRLPENVVPVAEFRQTVQRLEGAINRNTERLNTTQKDIHGLGQRVAAVVTSTRRDIAKAQSQHRNALIQMRRSQRTQATNNMFISLIMQQQIQRQLSNHTHPVTAVNSPTGPATSTDGDNTMLMFLPMMMMGSSEGEGQKQDDSGMMMMAMMMFGMR